MKVEIPPRKVIQKMGLIEFYVYFVKTFFLLTFFTWKGRVIVFILSIVFFILSYGVGIMKYPLKDSTTLSIQKQQELQVLNKKIYVLNEKIEKEIYIEPFDKLGGITKEINELIKKRNDLKAQKWQILRKADYERWQFRLKATLNKLGLPSGYERPYWKCE